MVFVLRKRWSLSWTWKVGHNYISECLSTQNVQLTFFSVHSHINIYSASPGPPLPKNVQLIIPTSTSPLCHYLVHHPPVSQGRSDMKACMGKQRQIQGKLDVLAKEGDFWRSGGEKARKATLIHSANIQHLFLAIFWSRLWE